MIHYTLLPEKEIKSLKKEYRTRLFIVLLFFISYAILAGIVSLIPSYVFSYNQEKEALKNLQVLQADRHERGTDTIIKDLSDAQELIKKLKKHEDTVEFSQTISEVIAHKTPEIFLQSFQISQPVDTASSSLSVIIQGKSSTREALIAFKKSLEQNPLISKIDLPVSDLAKSKDISFSLNLTIQIK